MCADVRFGSKADVTLLNCDVGFTSESGHRPRDQDVCFGPLTDVTLFDHVVGERDELHKRLYFDLHQCRGSRTEV